MPDDQLADPQQTIAELRRELAQCKAERDEALAQQTATAEVLQVINASPGDLAPVFDAMLEKALDLCDVAYGSLHLTDGDAFRAVAVRGIPEAFAAVLRRPIRLGPNHPVHELVAGASYVMLSDGAEHDDPIIQNAVKLAGMRTALWVPLRKDDALLGYIVASRKETRPFADKQIALLQNFAAQAVIAMENARLITETREALEQQTATAEVLQVINSSPGDLAPVFDAMLEKAMRLCGAAFGTMAVFKGDSGHTVAARGVPAAFAEFRRRNPFTGGPNTVVDRVLGGEPFVQLVDAKDDDVYRRGDPNRRALVDLGEVRTYLGVPLTKDGVVLGAINVYRQEVRPFTDKQIALLQNFAAQAVIAMENARLITETREALEQQTATAEVLQVINSSPGDLAPVFDAILEKAHSLCGAPCGSLQVYDGEQFRAVATRGLPEPFAAILRQGFRLDANDQELSPDRVIQIADETESVGHLAPDHPSRAAVELAGIRTVLFVPLHKDNVFLGRIVAARQEVRPFTDKQIALLQNFAAQAVIAMENARLITETREALEQQTATAEVLQVINSSPGDLAPVFDSILEKAHSLCGAAHGSLQTFDGEHFRAVATHGHPTEFAEMLRQPSRPDPGSAQERLVRGERFVHITDVGAQLAQAPDDQWLRAGAGLVGTHTLLYVPLRKDDCMLGLIVAARNEARPFADREIALLENFAAQAVIAMENARLITETREALEQQTATAEVLQVINSSPGDLAPVFDAILEKAHRLCGASLGSLQIYDGEHVRAVAVRGEGVPERLIDLLRQGTRLGPSLPYWPLVHGERFVQIADLKEAAARIDNPIAQATVALSDIRTLLFVPLRKDDAYLGHIVAGRTEVSPFSEKEIALLENFAAQAVIAMENARLITETREALEQQTATAEVLQVINSSPGDLAPVFDAILKKAMVLCDVSSGHVYRFEGDAVRAVAAAGDPEFVAWILRGNPQPPAEGGIVHRMMQGEHVVHIPDAHDSVAYRAGTLVREIIDKSGMRATLGVALRTEDALLGTILLTRREVRPFTDKQIALLENFAAQAVIAMENARLLGELRARTDEVAGWNKELEARVATQLAEIERTGKLRRFLAPQLADLIVAQGDESILESHRREIVVVFCDLRGFTGFAERAEPEEVMALLRDYHAAMGPIVASFEGTLDHYAGDGIMVFFNDPLPTPDPARRAIDMAVAMRGAAQELLRSWRRHGHDIGFGVGISQGYATLGQIGFAERMDYTAIGTVTNLAARLCGEAKDGQILVSRRVAIAVEDSAELEEIGDLSLKGLSQAVLVYNVPQ